MGLHIIKMIYTKLQIKSFSLLATSLIVGFVTVACDCEKKPDGTDTNKAGKVILEVTPASLLGDQQRDMTVMLKLEGNTGTVNLEKLKLKILLITKGADKSTLYYKNGSNETQVDTTVELPLSHFTTTKELTEEEPSLPLLFKIAVPDEGNIQVSIQFILLGENNNQLSEDETTWHSSPSKKPVDLKLQRREGDRVLQGAEKRCRLEITNLGTQKIENINDNQLQLKITIEGGTVKIEGAQEQQDGSYILDFSVRQPERFKGSNSIFQTVEMQQIQGNRIRLVVALLYEGVLQNNPIEVIWEEGELEIRRISNRFFGKETAAFHVYNNTQEYIPTSELTFELISNDQASFQFIKPRHSPIQKVGASISFNQLEPGEDIFSSGSGTGFEFVIDDPKGQIKAGVQVQVKRKGKVVATSEKIVWEAQGIAFKLFLTDKEGKQKIKNKSDLIDNQACKLILKNIGNIPANTDEIKVSLTNTEGVSFKLGHIEGINITKTLSEVLGNAVPIQPSSAVNIDLQVAQDAKTINQEQAVLNLTFQDKEDNVLVEEKVKWKNNSKFSVLQEKALEAAPIYNNFDKKCTPLSIEIGKFNNLYRTSDIDLESYKQDLPNWSDNLVALYKLRKEAEDALIDLPNFKKVYVEALNQNKNRYSDEFKKGLEQIIQQVAHAIENKYFVTRIEETMTEAFDLITQKVGEFLEKARSYQGNNLIAMQQYITAIQASAAIADKFATEIGTSEAERLATEIKQYNQQAEEL